MNGFITQKILNWLLNQFSIFIAFEHKEIL